MGNEDKEELVTAGRTLNDYTTQTLGSNKSTMASLNNVISSVQDSLKEVQRVVSPFSEYFKYHTWAF